MQFRGRRTEDALHLTRYETRGGREHIIDEVPPIYDLALDKGQSFQFLFSAEHQVPIIVHHHHDYHPTPYTIANPSDWDRHTPYQRKKEWDWVPSRWKDLFEETFAEPTGIADKTAGPLWFGFGGTDVIRIFVWSDEEVPLEEGAGALHDLGYIGAFVDKEEEEELLRDAMKQLKEDKPDLDVDSDEFKEQAYDLAQADLTYTESGFIPSDQLGIDHFDPKFEREFLAAVYYISRLMFPTDEDIEVQSEPPEVVSPL